MDRYVVIDAAGKAVNTILWDGESEWTPPEGCTVASEESAEAQQALAVAAEEAASGDD